MGLRSIVQTIAAVGGTGTSTTAAVTMGAAPTNGNLLLAVGILSSTNGVPAANTGWTVQATDGPAAGGVYVALYSKYAGAGESTNQQPEANGRNIWGLHVWEISGVVGTYATDVFASHLNANFVVFTTGPATTVSFNTGHNNELVLGGIVGNSGGGSQTTLSSATYTADSSVADANAPFAAAIGFHHTFPTSGTAVAATVSWSPNVNENVLSCFIELDAGTSSSTETAAVNLTLNKVSFGASAGLKESTTAALVLSGISYLATSGRKETDTVALALSKVTLRASVIDLGAAGAGAVHFTTFGA